MGRPHPASRSCAVGPEPGNAKGGEKRKEVNPMTTTLTPESPWTGWHRPLGGTWEEYCRASTEREAWDALLDLAEPGDRTVTRGNRRPEDRPRQGTLFA